MHLCPTIAKSAAEWLRNFWKIWHLKDFLAITYVFDYIRFTRFHTSHMQSVTTSLNDKFFAPVLAALSRAENSRRCSEYSDQEHLSSGIRRVLETVISGRDWVQRLQMKLNLNLSVSNFFSSLRSVRRKELVEEISADVRGQTDRKICHQPGSDPLVTVSK